MTNDPMLTLMEAFNAIADEHEEQPEDTNLTDRIIEETKDK